ncbi:MAG TPA: plasmid mobilization relaxosome protein MobC [Candidatus Coprocola pullicola]|nr:plasmid mobilization relaxosome protein MobC [Candidatus Coprocola pullicola]
MKRRNNKVTVRLTNAEKQHLEKQAYVAGMNMEQFIRNLIAGSNLKERPPEYWKEVVSQLSAIGNNINQIAHNTNITKTVSNSDMERTLSLMGDVWNVVKGI